MCGRYTITADGQQLALRFGAEPSAAGVAARYNAAPTQQLPVIANAEPNAIQLLTWGLVPAWVQGKTDGSRLINARLETAATRPSFRDAWRQRRCLVLADGFYEWQRTARGKVPMRITLKSNEPFAFAGLWGEWRGSSEDAALRTFTHAQRPHGAHPHADAGDPAPGAGGGLARYGGGPRLAARPGTVPG